MVRSPSPRIKVKVKKSKLRTTQKNISKLGKDRRAAASTNRRITHLEIAVNRVEGRVDEIEDRVIDTERAIGLPPAVKTN